MKSYMKSISTLIIVLFAIIQGSNAMWPCEKGSGTTIKEERNVEYFNKIRLLGTGKVYIKQSDRQSIYIETDDNLMKYIKTYVSDEVLTIKPEELICPRVMNIFISVKDLQGLKIKGTADVFAETPIKTQTLSLIIEGTGDIRFDEVYTEGLKAEISGSGNIRFKAGKADRLYLNISGSGDIDAREIEANQCNIEIYGSGDCKVFAKNELYVKIYGSGDVVYYGDPQKFEKSIFGLGKVKKKK
ncbi:MAG: hypothetical protein QG635_329 [Bacteroidota bacterium]|nr:hypothetical protein [Bacteroidota bacterium]